ncbi:hypothetical protein J2X76_005439 [Neorhizobium sp. 2083]|uniref:hypothetical protein n=1 Tax=Neorhizobium sp. 2083 TaxID=2817762 RepID=UPI002854831B|nr:hypothetical protein [Neorhizobium sp. 2083]MDR6820242.1 hypothetical protein [Neorhizobium sp. 2083]
MTTTHYLVFIGATPSLSSELNRLIKRVKDLIVVAPAMPKSARGLTDAAVSAALEMAYGSLGKAASHSEPARFSVWSFSPLNERELEVVWKSFGKSAWIEFIPSQLRDKDGPTRTYIETRIQGLTPVLHEISSSVFASRKTSPFTLPLENFRSPVTSSLQRMWYRDLKVDEIKKVIQKNTVLHKQRRNEGHSHYEDDRNLLFAPAKDTECHGKAHPTGSVAPAFLGGRFRFGVALYPGFHYDVRPSKAKTLQSVLVDSSGNERAMKPEKREYINIFPNDFLLPEK